MILTLESPLNKCYNTIIKSRKERETALRLLLCTGIAQLVEQRSPKPCAVGPSPSARARVCNALRTTARQAGDGHTHLTKSICPMRCRAFQVFIGPPSPAGLFIAPLPFPPRSPSYVQEQEPARPGRHPPPGF